MNLTRFARSLIATASAAMCAAVVLVGGPAHAAAPASHESTVRVSGDLCKSRGTTNYYVHHWQSIPVRKIMNSPFVYREHSCRVDGFRLYKSSANTAGEVAFARHFLKTDRPKKPTIFCRTTTGRAYFLDLGFYWGMADARRLNVAEQQHYTAWAHAYADRHGCRLFVPKSA